MADLESIKIPSLTEMSTDEAIEHLRQIRLSRRAPVKKKSTSTKAKIKQSKSASGISKAQAAELLKLLE